MYIVLLPIFHELLHSRFWLFGKLMTIWCSQQTWVHSRITPIQLKPTQWMGVIRIWGHSMSWAECEFDLNCLYAMNCIQITPSFNKIPFPVNDPHSGMGVILSVNWIGDFGMTPNYFPKSGFCNSFYYSETKLVAAHRKREPTKRDKFSNHFKETVIIWKYVSFRGLSFSRLFLTFSK